jgi:tetratricopeptide (TPR) repeat protein
MAHGNLAAELVNGSTDEVREAKAHAEAALRLKPDEVEARYNLAGALFRLEEWNRAAAEYERVLAELTSRPGVDSRLPRIYWSLGRALAGGGRHEEAVGRYRAAIATDARASAFHRDLGVSLGTLRRNDEALAAFLEAVRLEPNLSDNHVNAGLALLALKRPAEAIAYLESAIRLDPGNGLAREYLTRARGR